MPSSRDDYVFFWKVDMPYGWASQWYYSPFKARIQLKLGATTTVDSKRELEFLSTEHWMMACKALVFGDLEVLQKVLDSGVGDMRAVKALGRKVQNFDDAVWKQVREEMVLVGNLHKFRQNEEIRKELFGTGEKMIVEASPRDRIWGVGFEEKRALEVKDRWGLNLLGKALMKTRKILRDEREDKTCNANVESTC
ncbi:hypothetical protein BDY19DRAFT_986997 [Irpex rosettiformis]|uniref:Uncharacterized protein n=1 Tax=Irpex rosettiformis TaxID=378272 RepID=A0ACB8TUK4_9APHY|nr:hypothetical protein BDY19DRAFT_986997 [Irpex rosettiformis]